MDKIDYKIPNQINQYQIANEMKWNYHIEWSTTGKYSMVNWLIFIGTQTLTESTIFSQPMENNGQWNLVCTDWFFFCINNYCWVDWSIDPFEHFVVRFKFKSKCKFDIFSAGLMLELCFIIINSNDF